MRKRRELLIAVSCLAALVAIVAFFSRDQEPRYQGYPLSYWVSHEGDQIDEPAFATPERLAADHAIREIGTNALPFLLKWIQCEPQPWRSKATELARRLPTWNLANWIETSRAETHANKAADALEALGPEASPAIPELIRLMNNPAATFTALRVNGVLSRIGTNALPALISAIEDPGFAQRGLALGAIRDMHPPPSAAAAAVPALIHCLSETNLPHMAADTLGSLRAAPDLAVPALVACLQSPNQELRWASVEALSHFGTNSLAAVPPLIHCLEDRSSEVASEAAKTLGKLGLEPNIAIPALASAIQSGDSNVSIPSVIALGTFGAQATNELPLLTNLLSDPVWQVRFQASNAIERITGSASTNAPAQRGSRVHVEGNKPRP